MSEPEEDGVPDVPLKDVEITRAALDAPREMGARCAVCENRPGVGITSDGRLMCYTCARSKRLRILVLFGETSHPERPDYLDPSLGAPPS